jgi:DNA-directed RNA polymerase specialized sigma24 family protein
MCTANEICTEYARTAIRVKTTQLIRRRGFSRSERPDIEQELMVYLLSQADRFDPSRSSLNTFVARVIDSGAATLVRNRKRLKRCPEKPIGVMPSLILVPTALSAVGSQLFKSLELRDTTPNAKFPISNPHQGKFRVEVSRYLSNAQYTGNSSKAWYMLADASDLPVIEVAFLNGQESPTIETSEADFNVLGVQMRGYHDFGVALQDPRGGVKAKGEA